MKKLAIFLFFTFCFKFLIFGQYSDSIPYPYLLQEASYEGPLDSTYTSPGSNQYMDSREYLENTVWLGDDIQGDVPYDAIFADDKVYVYGDRRVVAIDNQTKQVIDAIDISDYSSTVITRHLFDTPKPIVEKRLAFDGNNKLFAVSDKLEITVINTNDNSIEHVIPKPENEILYDNPHHYFLMLKYDERNNNIYLAINYKDVFSFGLLYVYNADTYQFEHTFEFDHYIPDYEFNTEYDFLYLSSGHTLYIYDSQDFNVLRDDITFDHDFGQIVYANDPDPEDNIHKVYCFPDDPAGDPNTYVIDGDYYDNAHIHTIHNNTQHHTFKTAIYNSEHNKIFAYYFLHSAYVFETGYDVIDAETDYELNEHALVRELVLNSIEYGDKTIFSSTKNLLVLGGEEGTALSTIPLGDDIFMYGLACNKNNPDTLYVTNTVNTEVFVFNDDMDLTNTVNVGGHVYFAVYNKTYHKVYFYNKDYENSTKLFILSTITNQVDVIDLGFSISGITYNRLDNRLYVTYFNQEENNTYIKSIDGNTNDILENEEIIINRPKCVGLFWAPPNRLFISVRHELGSFLHDYVIYNIETSQIIKTITSSHLGSNYGTVFSHFAYDPVNSRVAISSKTVNKYWNDPNYYKNGEILVVDEDNEVTQEFQSPWSPDKILFDDTGEKLFVLHKNYFYLVQNPFHYFSYINLSTGEITQQYLYCPNSYPVDFETANTNLLYISQTGNTCYDNIEVYNYNEGTFQEPIEIDGPVKTLQYNEINHELYAFVPWNFTDPHNLFEMEVCGIDLSSGEHSKIKLEQFESKDFRMDFTAYMHDMIINDNNKLYISGGGHSNIKVINCSDYEDKLYVEKGWNWLSFPKLPRANNDPYSAQALLENLDPSPNVIDMIGRGDDNNEDKTLHKDNNGWFFNGLEQVQSTRGYKLMTSNSGITVLPLTGTNLDATYPVNIFSGENDDHENWVGYFLHETQDPFDALINVMPALKSITGQHWAATNLGTQTHPYWVTTPPYPLEYGDMLILRCYYDTQFSWNQPDNGTSSKTYVAPQEFTFEEQASYTPIFIELDTNNSPLEIGAFIGDSCIGGCVVEPEDTLVLVPGFIDGADGDSITFEEYFGNKSTQKEQVKAYYVYNVEKQRKEKRSIKTGENKDFYLVSFKPGGESFLLDRGENLSLTVYPNPAKDMLNLEYSLPEDSQFTIEIFDLYGRLIAVPESGYQAEGYHQLQWNLKDRSGTKVKPGLYLIKLSCGNNTTAGRVMVN